MTLLLTYVLEGRILLAHVAEGEVGQRRKRKCSGVQDLKHDCVVIV